jgi:hypothetical protein
MQLWQSFLLDVISFALALSRIEYLLTLASWILSAFLQRELLCTFLFSGKVIHARIRCSKALSSTVSSMSLVRLRKFYLTAGHLLDKSFFCCFYSIMANILRLNVLSVIEGGAGY